MAQGAMGDPGRRVRIVDIKVTPIAFRDPPLRNAAGVHEPYALRSIIEITASNGQTGLGEGYGDAASLMALEVASIEALAEAFPGYPLRIDPNGAWSMETAISVAARLGLLIEYYEDPVDGLDAWPSCIGRPACLWRRTWSSPASITCGKA